MIGMTNSRDETGKADRDTRGIKEDIEGDVEEL